MADNLTEWRERIRDRIRQRLPPGLKYDHEADERFHAVLDLEVPSDAELSEMQLHGELPSDEELARDGGK